MTAKSPEPIELDELCELLSLTLDDMAKDQLTFTELVDHDPWSGSEEGTVAGLSFAYAFRGPRAADRYNPAIRYLAKREEARVIESVGRPPELTDAIRENAKALDAEIDRGRCQ